MRLHLPRNRDDWRHFLSMLIVAIFDLGFLALVVVAAIGTLSSIVG